MLGIGHVVKNISRLLTLSTEANSAVVKDRLGDTGLEKASVLNATEADCLLVPNEEALLDFLDDAFISHEKMIL